MDKIKKIFADNKLWVAEKLSVNPAYFEDLGKGQSPEFLYIGCSDSRVSAEELMGVEPGEVF
ncbi:MAG: carbonic anhydrase, partial [Ferruginibacter sp.]